MSLSPDAVREATFDKAPFGKRGYHEEQVDQFLDRVEAALSGTDPLTAADVRAVIFDSAPLVKRGYHETQVDDFLDKVAAALDTRASPTFRPANSTVEPTSSTLGPTSSTLEPTSSPFDTEHTVEFPTVAPTPAAPAAPAPPPATPPHAPAAATAPIGHAPESDVPFLPLPPAPPGVRGYRPSDVEKLAALLARAATDVDTPPTADELAGTRLGITFFTGQGYHPAAVDAVVQGWLDELRRRER